MQDCVCFSAGSVPSLAAGLLFGSLAGLGAYQLSQDPRNIWVFLGTSTSLSLWYSYVSRTFYPKALVRWHVAGSSHEDSFTTSAQVLGKF